MSGNAIAVPEAGLHEEDIEYFIAVSEETDAVYTWTWPTFFEHEAVPEKSGSPDSLRMIGLHAPVGLFGGPRSPGFAAVRGLWLETGYSLRWEKLVRIEEPRVAPGS